MSVIIYSMDKPERPWECLVRAWGFCLASKTSPQLRCSDDDKFPKGCPMKQLSPHGDLIDRSVAVSHPFANGNYDKEHASPEFIAGYESYREWIDDLPAVVPASEEREGSKSVNNR